MKCCLKTDQRSKATTFHIGCRRNGMITSLRSLVTPSVECTICPKLVANIVLVPRCQIFYSILYSPVSAQTSGYVDLVLESVHLSVDVLRVIYFC